jgi:hypothetical protein
MEDVVPGNVPQTTQQRRFRSVVQQVPRRSVAAPAPCGVEIRATATQGGEVKVRVTMTPDWRCATPDDPMSRATQIMRELNVGIICGVADTWRKKPLLSVRTMTSAQCSSR